MFGIIRGIEDIANYLLVHAWLLVIFYYCLKVFLQFIVFLISPQKGERENLITQAGADLSFMGLSFFGKAITTPNNTYTTKPPLVIFLFSVFFLLLYALSYYFYRKQVEIKGREQIKGVNIFRKIHGGKWITNSRVLLIIASIFLGIVSFNCGINMH